MNAATTLQATWRGFAVRNQYLKSILNIVIVQCVGRKWIAMRHVAVLKEDKLLAENNAATIIQSSWKAFVTRREFVITVGGKLMICYFIFP